MTLPTPHVYLGDPLTDPTSSVFTEPASWTDVTEDVRGMSWQRGRQKQLDEVGAGTGSLRLRQDGHRNYDVSSTPATFPTAAVLDTFTRGDTGPPPSASWTTWLDSGLKVVSNQCAPNDTGGNNAYWTANFGPDQECYVDIVTLPAAGGSTEVWARLDTTPVTGYAVNHTVGAGTVSLTRWVAATPTTIGSWSATLAAGDAIGIRCMGAQIEAWVRVSGVWSRAGYVIDATIDGTVPSGGSSRIALNNSGNGTSAARYDNFGGGNVVRSMNLMRQVKIEAVHSAVTYPLFRGFARSWKTIWAAEWVDYSEVEVSLVDAIGVFAPWLVVPTASNVSISTRIDALLTSIGFPAGMRSLTGGSTVLPGPAGSVEMWSHVQDCVRSDIGLSVCRVDGRGYVVFGPSATTSYVLGDGDGEVPYTAAGLEANDDLVFTYVSVTGEGGAAQVSDRLSGSSPPAWMGQRALQIPTLNISNADALLLANALFQRYYLPRARPEKVIIRPGDDDARWTAVLDLEPEDKVTMIRRPSVGNPFAQGMTVVGLEHSVNPALADWTATYSLDGGALA